MTETSAGSIRELREKVSWLARTSDRNANSFATGQWVRDLSSLAHAEIRWDLDRWAVAPPVIARLPAADGTAVVVGARPKGLKEKLEETEVSLFVVEAEAGEGMLAAPDSWVVQFDDVATLPEIARRSGVVYGGCAAVRLANVLVPLKLGSPAAPPSVNVADLEQLQLSGQFSPATPARDGLYRMRIGNRLVHLYRRDGTWYHCDRAIGTYMFFAQRSTSVLRWRAESGRGRVDAGALFVDRIAPLPVLQARAATLCSGFAPVLNQAAQTYRYSNVPRAVATQIAESLEQKLEVTG
ncbi:hypothetical protein ACFWNN_22305 [Lentzea sp. NPDC058450]|uniref:hypothetical protein n=1 Tax=Lentzea sp. NPDC058450 TaxID=3346505 RepID=UPI00365A39E3